MRKFFLLPLAALAASLFFSACTDDKDDETTDPSSSSLGSDLEFVMVACDMGSTFGLVEGGICMELNDIPSSQLATMKAHCTEGDLGYGMLGAGTLKSKCPDNAVYDCVLPPSLYGFEGKSFYYGEFGEISNGMCPGSDDDEPNTCTDPSYGGEGPQLPYEGETYKTVKIGCQTWMAENLNYETEEGSKCYKDDPENCEIYGRLYTWSTAMEVCPSGWHLPTLTEWQTLIKTVGGKSVAGKHLKSTYGWRESYWNDEEGNGLDTYGFTALPGAGFFIASTSASWWSTNRDKSNSDYAIGISIDGDEDSAHESSAQDGLTKSVRCIQDP